MKSELERFGAECKKLKGLEGEAYQAQLDRLLKFPTNKAWLETPDAKRVRELALAADTGEKRLLFRMSPLFAQFTHTPAHKDFIMENVRQRVQDYHKDKGAGNGFNLGLAVKALTEELLPIYGQDYRSNKIRSVAMQTVNARDQFLKRLQALRSAERLYRMAEDDYLATEVTFHLLLQAQLITPYTGDIQSDPARWFLTAKEIITGSATQDWKVTRSKIEYYVKQGLLPKPIRVGVGGKALYSLTTAYRLAIIHEYRLQGKSLSEIREMLPQTLASTLEANLGNPEIVGMLSIVAPDFETILRLRGIVPQQEKGGEQKR
jgi:DNA-binding transcriptional MerR regulator